MARRPVRRPRHGRKTANANSRTRSAKALRRKAGTLDEVDGPYPVGLALREISLNLEFGGLYPTAGIVHCPDENHPGRLWANKDRTEIQVWAPGPGAHTWNQIITWTETPYKCRHVSSPKT